MLDPIRTFLDQPLLAYLSTIDSAGFPHTVPVWFGVDGDDLIFPTMADRVRLKHIAANPNGAVTIGGDLSEGAGYLLKGTLRIDADDQALRHALIRRYITDDQQAKEFIAMVDQAPYVLVRLTPAKVIKVR
jgi:PPOX class probable F420-dependent enzyme